MSHTTTVDFCGTGFIRGTAFRLWFSFCVKTSATELRVGFGTTGNDENGGALGRPRPAVRRLADFYGLLR